LVRSTDPDHPTTAWWARRSAGPRSAIGWPPEARRRTTATTRAC